MLVATCGVALSLAVRADCMGMVTHAHRGDSSRPENSTSAVAKTASGPWNGVEIDLQELRDGTWVLHHDPFLKRTTSLARGTTKDLDSHAWREVLLKDRAGRMTSEAAPFLSTVLESIASSESLVVNAEIKQMFNGCESVRSAVEAMARGRPSGQWFLTSMDRRHLQCARPLDPNGYLGLIVIDAESIARKALIDSRRGKSAALASRTAGRLMPAFESEKWLAQLIADVPRPLGIHVDAEHLARAPSVLRWAKEHDVAVFTYGLSGDRLHARHLSDAIRATGLAPSGVILDGDPGAFCADLRAGRGS